MEIRFTRHPKVVNRSKSTTMLKNKKRVI